MVYNLSNPVEMQQFKTRAAFLAKKAENKDNCIVELKERQPQRTIQQNKYAWVTITYVALEEGYTIDIVESFFKDVNKDIFQRSRQNKKGETFCYMRHMNELDKEEMSVCIDRWLIHCSRDRGIYIPSPEDHYYLQWQTQVEREKERNKEFL